MGPQLALRRSEGSIAAVPNATAVGGYNSEMIGGAGTQAVDVGSDIPECVPSLRLHKGGAPVAGCHSPLELDSRHQPMRIQ